ncbi:hypothetical protein XENOCAPTIV_008675 [Xenoophorus captivus]|uniref:Uncharacterized protein n=1 Tax=Xenoophorus captivus TaxID=1517983 RepID=A0ABV0QRU3_9TELE
MIYRHKQQQQWRTCCSMAAVRLRVKREKAADSKMKHLDQYHREKETMERYQTEGFKVTVTNGKPKNRVEGALMSLATRGAQGYFLTVLILITLCTPQGGVHYLIYWKCKKATEK